MKDKKMKFRKKVKPILRFAGSKYRKIDKIIEILDVNENDIFLDMFGGSCIVGVNVKHLTKANVTINDFDKTFPLTTKQAVINMCSFQGLGKNFTAMAEEYFIRRVINGYWKKFDEYHIVLNKCNIIQKTFENIDIKKFNKIYVDPPYDDVNGLYKKDFTKKQHIELKEKLSSINGLKTKILISYNDTQFIRKLYED